MYIFNRTNNLRQEIYVSYGDIMIIIIYISSPLFLELRFVCYLQEYSAIVPTKDRAINCGHFHIKLSSSETISDDIQESIGVVTNKVRNVYFSWLYPLISPFKANLVRQKYCSKRLRSIHHTSSR